MRERPGPRFGTVSLDVDSTLCSIEGIDWLAARRGSAIAAQVAALTSAAMAGDVDISGVYARRLETVAPSRDDVSALSVAYRNTLDAGAGTCVDSLRRADVRVVIVSGGIREAVLPLADALHVPAADVHAVPVRFAADGSYAGFDQTSPLVVADGKARAIRALADVLPGPVLHVGDGMTDAVAREAVDAFAAFTGFARRELVVRRADYVVGSFAAVTELVLGPGGARQ